MFLHIIWSCNRRNRKNVQNSQLISFLKQANSRETWNRLSLYDLKDKPYEYLSKLKIIFQTNVIMMLYQYQN